MNIHDNNSNEVLTNIPSILYKYRTWKLDSHKDLLKEGLVFFAAPNTFADPFDCNTPKKYPSDRKSVV